MTYIYCKNVITNSINSKTLNTAEMLEKLDVFYLGNRITKEQYEELVSLINEYVTNLTNETSEN